MKIPAGSRSDEEHGLNADSNKTGIFSVSELTRLIQSLLEETFPFVWVEGEISNFSMPSSGHYYMVLKDPEAQIRTVMFRMQARNLKFLPENGMNVLARGRISLYAPRGEYQLVLDHMEPLGTGALALAFEQTKKKLAAMGLFDSEIKRPLPFLPQRVAVVTSPTGAAIRDFLKVAERRFANLDITVVPVRVQGDQAAEDIIHALQRINRDLPADVIVITRGGGSIEDLQAFNEESVALAIRASAIPVVSAVGHEIDTTIADLAADMRAPTPSAAAEILIAEKALLVDRLNDITQRLTVAASRRLAENGRLLQYLASRLKDPRRRINDHRIRLDELQGRLFRNATAALKQNRSRLDYERRALSAANPAEGLGLKRRELSYTSTAFVHAIKGVMEKHRSNLASFERRIQDLSPLSVLERGYSITRTIPQKSIVTEASTLGPGDMVEILLARGSLDCEVRKTEPDRKNSRALQGAGKDRV
jgi:exodeoxyribonuclease VII large subunit